MTKNRKKKKLNRENIKEESLSKTFFDLRKKLNSRLERKGYGSFASIHEGLGVIAEEYDELLEAIRTNNHKKIEQELLDVEVGCLFLRACIKQKTLDW